MYHEAFHYVNFIIQFCMRFMFYSKLYLNNRFQSKLYLNIRKLKQQSIGQNVFASNLLLLK